MRSLLYSKGMDYAMLLWSSARLAFLAPPEKGSQRQRLQYVPPENSFALILATLACHFGMLEQNAKGDVCRGLFLCKSKRMKDTLEFMFIWLLNA